MKRRAGSGPEGGEGREAFTPVVVLLLATALLQAVGIGVLLGGARPAFLVTPYYRLGAKEPDWRSFDRRARACLEQEDAADRGKTPGGVDETLRRGLDAEDELFTLRNRIHGLNMEASRWGAELLDGLGRRDLAGLLAPGPEEVPPEAPPPPDPSPAP